MKKNHILTLIILLFVGCIQFVSAQTYTMAPGAATINTCSGTILDPGGAGDYATSIDVTQTICSTTGECVQLSFTSFGTEACCDNLTLYDGNSTAASIIGVYAGATNPGTISTTAASNGCMTLAFHSDGSINGAGFSATIACIPCPPMITLGQGGNTIISCGGMLTDPGAGANYPNNADVTQTICSGVPNQCVTLSFTSFNTEATFDRLSIYDGTNTTADLLGVFSGFTVPQPVSSTTNSTGCLTLVFSTNGSVNNSGFQANLSCAVCQEPIITPTGFCEQAMPFCTDVAGGITFPASTGTTSQYGTPGQIGCLFSTPNPAWYFMKVDQTGTLNININSGFDVDFICWGPFTQTEWDAGVCTDVLDYTWANNAANYVSCSYSASASEICSIANAQSGEYYALLLTNYSGQETNITFAQNPNSTGTTDCSVFCSVTATPAPTACDPATNTYILAGTIDFTNPPTSGSLTITNSSGGFMTFNAPFATSVNYNFTNLSSNANAEQLTVVFSDDNTCAAIGNYTAPATCSTCPVTAGVSGPACEGQNVTLTATNVANGTYLWSGPNGFTSNSQNPTIIGVTPSMSGVYQVTAANPVNGCSSISSINVFVSPTPAAPTISNDGPVCEGTPLNLTSSSTLGASYLWNGPNSFTSNLQNPSFPIASNQGNGVYTCQVIVNTCSSPLATTTAVINPYPQIPTPIGVDTLCEGDNLVLTVPFEAGITYEWTNAAGLVLSSSNTLSINSMTPIQSGQYFIRIDSSGCWSQPFDIDVKIYPIPTTPVFNPAVINICELSPLNLSGPAPLPLAGTEYDWSGPNSYVDSTQNVLVTDSVTQTESGIYSLIITEYGCSSLSGSLSVLVLDLPISDAGIDKSVCSGVPIEIGNASPSPSNTYSWSPTEGIDFSNISNPNVEVSNFSDLPYDLSYILTTSITVSTTTCSSKDTVVVTIKPQPSGAFEIPEPQCFTGNSFDFQGTGNYTSNATFEWDFGPWAIVPATTNLTDENPQDISFNSTGNQLVAFTVTHDGCVGNTYQSTVLIHKMPVANFIADTLVGCSPMIVNFSNLSESVDPFKTIEWTILDETIVSNNNPTIVFNNPGQYDISIKVSTEYGCEDTYFINNFISVNPSPRADFRLSPDVVQIIQPEMDFIDLSDDADEVYYIINRADTVYQAETTYTFPDTGVYSVRQVVTTQFGCVDSLTKQAVVELGYKYYIPSGFSPNDDGYNDFFKVYGEDVLDFNMIIYNRWGQKLYQSYDIENGWDGKTRTSTGAVDGGVYFYRVEMVQRNGIKNTIEGNVVLLK